MCLYKKIKHPKAHFMTEADGARLKNIENVLKNQFEKRNPAV